MQLSGVPLTLQEIGLVRSLSATYVIALDKYRNEKNKNARMPFMTELSEKRELERYTEARRASMLARNNKTEGDQ